MTTATEPTAGAARSDSRVVIAIDPPGDYAEILEAATRLAARLEAQLEALLVEDPRLLDVARLPFTRRFDRAGRESELDDRVVFQAWERERNRLGRAIDACAARLNVRSRVRVVQGGFLSEALSISKRVDVTVLAHSRALGRGLTASERSWLRAVPGARHPTRRARPVWVYADDSPAADRALRLGVDMACDDGTSLVVLHPPSLRREALKEQVDQARAGRRLPLVDLPVSSSADRALIQLHRPEGAGCVLVPRECLSTQHLPEVMEALAAKPCPLILVS